MFKFYLAPFTNVFYNNEQILFMPDNQKIDPGWEKVSITFSSDGSTLDIINNNQIVCIIANTQLIFHILKSKEFFIGWINEKEELESRLIEVNLSGLLQAK